MGVVQQHIDDANKRRARTAERLQRTEESLAELERQRNCHMKGESEIEQILGQVLDYPWYKDDQKNFPGATEETGVCVGEHVPITLAMEASRKISEQREQITELKRRLAHCEKVSHSRKNKINYLKWYQSNGKKRAIGLIEYLHKLERKLLATEDKEEGADER